MISIQEVAEKLNNCANKDVCNSCSFKDYADCEGHMIKEMGQACRVIATAFEDIDDAI